MRVFVRLACSLALVCFVATAVEGEDNKLPPEAKSILGKAEQLELLSLDPTEEKEQTKDSFHGYKVLGKTTVKGDAVKELVDGFLSGMEGEIIPYRCFNPRHGIRATHDGKTVELVICFQCSWFDVYAGSAEKGERLLVGQRPEPAFDKVLKDAGIPKAK